MITLLPEHSLPHQSTTKPGVAPLPLFTTCKTVLATCKTVSAAGKTVLAMHAALCAIMSHVQQQAHLFNISSGSSGLQDAMIFPVLLFAPRFNHAPSTGSHGSSNICKIFGRYIGSEQSHATYKAPGIHHQPWVLSCAIKQANTAPISAKHLPPRLLTATNFLIQGSRH